MNAVRSSWNFLPRVETCLVICWCREGIDLVLNSRVASVSKNCVTVVNSLKNETCEIPFGACVWATGVAMHPLIKQLQVCGLQGSCLSRDSSPRVTSKP
jgi:NADH dehydrogenase FAD-containing subunit